MIGKIERVELRDIWRHEAYDFTTWLEENIDILNDTINFSLVSADREQRAGSFSVDILAEDDSGNTIIIENQLGKSDHDHLGKLITYLSVHEAQVAIWIVADPRPEHVTAVAWLNETYAVDFYLLKLEAIKIGDSQVAPLFTVIISPNEDLRLVGQEKRERSEIHRIRKLFWESFLNQARTKTPIYSSISAKEYHWIGTSAGISGIGYNCSLRQHDVSVEIYIDRGKDSQDENEYIYEQLLHYKDQIEEKFGEPLEWQRLEGKQACRIRKTITLGGYRDDNWDEIHEAMTDTLIRLEYATKEYIHQLQLN